MFSGINYSKLAGGCGKVRMPLDKNGNGRCMLNKDHLMSVEGHTIILPRLGFVEFVCADYWEKIKPNRCQPIRNRPRRFLIRIGEPAHKNCLVLIVITWLTISGIIALPTIPS
jgi:hypothetical protein